MKIGNSFISFDKLIGMLRSFEIEIQINGKYQFETLIASLFLFQFVTEFRTRIFLTFSCFQGNTLKYKLLESFFQIEQKFFQIALILKICKKISKLEI